MQSNILTLSEVSFSYIGIKAVSNLSMNIKKGSITSLIGPNGAGKTTAFKLICGEVHPDEGNIFYKGEKINKSSPHQKASLGLAWTFQNIRLFPSLTVREHINIAQYNHYKSSLVSAIIGTPLIKQERIISARNTEEIMKKIKLEEYADVLAINLPYGLQRRVELARALGVTPNLLLLDEPTAGMNIQESDDIIELIKKLINDFDITILLVEHDMRVVMSISSEVWVMNEGTIISSGHPEKVKKDPIVIRAYLGD